MTDDKNEDRGWGECDDCSAEYFSMEEYNKGWRTLCPKCMNTSNNKNEVAAYNTGYRKAISDFITALQSDEAKKAVAEEIYLQISYGVKEPENVISAAISAAQKKVKEG